MAAPYPNKSQFTTTGDPIQEKAQSINEPSQRKTIKKKKIIHWTEHHKPKERKREKPNIQED